MWDHRDNTAGNNNCPGAARTWGAQPSEPSMGRSCPRRQWQCWGPSCHSRIPWLWQEGEARCRGRFLCLVTGGVCRSPLKLHTQLPQLCCWMLGLGLCELHFSFASWCPIRFLQSGTQQSAQAAGRRDLLLLVCLFFLRHSGNGPSPWHQQRVFSAQWHLFNQFPMLNSLLKCLVLCLVSWLIPASHMPALQVDSEPRRVHLLDGSSRAFSSVFIQSYRDFLPFWRAHSSSSHSTCRPWTAHLSYAHLWKLLLEERSSGWPESPFHILRFGDFLVFATSTFFPLLISYVLKLHLFHSTFRFLEKVEKSGKFHVYLSPSFPCC